MSVTVSGRLRLFVALDLPAAVRASLAAWAAEVAPEGVRLVPARNLHVTLAFLGSRAAADVEVVAAVLGRAAAPDLRAALGAPDGLRTASALWLPPRRPGVLTVALGEAAPLRALRDAVVAGLVTAIGFEPERRRFRPHVTVARVARGARVAGAHAEPPALPFGADALTLYRSHTEPGGSRYESLWSVPLSA